MPATEGIARRYAAAIGFAVVGELTRKPEWDGVASDPEIGLSGYCRVWVDEGGSAYYVHGKEWLMGCWPIQLRGKRLSEDFR